MQWCFHCYAVNPRSTGPSIRCGRPVQRPPNLSFDEQLIWTLGHPDGDRAMLAAQTLGANRVRAALPALKRVVDDDRDPFLSVQAMRSAIAIAGRDELRDWLERHAHSDSFMASAVARAALA
jgi:hypothetical protein